MLKFYVVPTSHIQQTWDKVEIMLDRAMAHSGGEYDLDQLKVLLTQGRQVLCVCTEEDLVIKCALTIEWINYPNDRVAFITAIGGKTDKQCFGEFEQWVKSNGVLPRFMDGAVGDLRAPSQGCYQPENVFMLALES